jgi:hypothetical protein
MSPRLRRAETLRPGLVSFGNGREVDGLHLRSIGDGDCGWRRVGHDACGVSGTCVAGLYTLTHRSGI